MILKKDCMMLSIDEPPHCTCGAEIKDIKRRMSENRKYFDKTCQDYMREIEQLQAENEELNWYKDYAGYVEVTNKPFSYNVWRAAQKGGEK